MLEPLQERERRWLSALLVLGTMTVAVILIGQVAAMVNYFNDIILIFFLAWLLAFILSPVPTAVERWVPSLPRIIVVVVTYLVLLVGLLLVAIVTAQALAGSISAFIDSLPGIAASLPELLAPWQRLLDQFGLRIDLLSSARTVLDAAASFGGTLVGPLTDLALASLSSAPAAQRVWRGWCVRTGTRGSPRAATGRRAEILLCAPIPAPSRERREGQIHFRRELQSVCEQGV